MEVIEESLKRHIEDDHQRHISIVTKVSELSARVALFAAIGAGAPGLISLILSFLPYLRHN